MALWEDQTEKCHIRAVAHGGGEGAVIGHGGCNREQSTAHLDDYQRGIRHRVPVKRTFVPEDKLEAVIKDLKSWSKEKYNKCPLERMRSIVKPKHRQPTLV
jgi:hypothetical protein